MNTIIKLLIGFAITFKVTTLNAQADLCDNCYVWEFATDNGERDQTTRLLSNDVEDILSQYSGCKVLQRSRFARLQEQINNEKDVVQSLTGVRSEIKSELKTIQAKQVIFGTVNRDFQGNVSLRLSFENLQTTHVKSNTVFLINEDYYNFDKRKEKLTAFINSMINTDGMMTVPVQEGGLPSKTSSTQMVDNYKFEIIKCKKQGSTVTCEFAVTSLNKNRKLRMFLGGNYGWYSTLFDDQGYQYYAERGTLANAAVPGYIDRYLIANVRTLGSVTFSNIATNATSIPSLFLALGARDSDDLSIGWVEFKDLKF